MATKTVMAIGAHPDDIEIGAGGTLAALSEQGYTTIIVDLTNGEPTPHGTVPIRLAEAELAKEILGVTHRHILDLPNRELEDTIDARKKVAALMRKYRPDILLGQYTIDAHPDHLASAALVTASRFYSKLSNSDIEGDPFYPGKVFHYYAFHLQAKIEPTFIFDISETFEKKLEAIKAFESQFITNKGNQKVLEQIETDARYWGKMSGCRYGEPYYCREHIKLAQPSALFEL